MRLRALGTPARARVAMSFFKTGPGEYGEGDVFVGVTVPEVRGLLRDCDAMPEREVLKLLRDRVHEGRLLAALILVRRFQRGDAAARERIFSQYCKHRRWINNWDLVDASAEHVLGGHLFAKPDRGMAFLRELAGGNLWDRRMAVLATFHFIRAKMFEPTFAIAELLLEDEEDLIHKAVGWMLREVGNRDLAAQERFMRRHYRRMPRTMLRYAIEKFPEPRRKAYLAGTV